MSEQVIATMRLALSPGAVIKFDSSRDTNVLLMPETVIVLNETAAAILASMDGKRTVGEIISQLGDEFDIDGNKLDQDNEDVRLDVLAECREFLNEMIELRLIKVLHD